LGVHRAQLGILIRGLQLLVPGGRLVYSTCSMNPVEDEAVVAHALLKLAEEGGDPVRLKPVEDELPQLKRASGVSQWRVRYRGSWYDDYDAVPEKLKKDRKILPTMFPPTAEQLAPLDIHRCMRVLPHYQDTGGFFIAVLEKLPSPPAAQAAVETISSEDADMLAAELVGRSVVTALASVEAEAASEELKPTIRSQEGAKAGSHVLRTLHCAPTNNGGYDALYSLTPGWLGEVRAFFGLSEAFDMSRLVSRSITGKQIFVLSKPVIALLRSDKHTKFKLVNTGTRILERSEIRGLPFPFRLAQEGVHALVPHMGRQLLFAPPEDLKLLLLRHNVKISELPTEALRTAAAAAAPGALAIVLDEDGTGRLLPEKPPMLVLAGMRSLSNPGFLELNVKKAEASSMLRRMGHVEPADPPPAGDGAEGEDAMDDGGEAGASCAAGTAADAPAGGDEPMRNA